MSQAQPNPTQRVPPDEEAFTAAHLAVRVPPVGLDTLCGEALDRFAGLPDLRALAVVEDSRVLGLLDREALTGTFARPLMADLYARRPVKLLMDPAPLVVEAARPLGEVGRLIATEKPGALASGFVVVEGGRYLGIGSAMDLMVRSLEQTELRARQREEARHAAEAARHAAEAANQAKTAFFANMSHEIRTPLNAMMGFAELLEEEVLGPLGHPLYRDYAHDIAESGRHLMELINDLLDLSKAEADRLELIEGLVDVPRVALSSARLMAERASRTRVSILTQVPTDLPPLRGDERKLRQMLLNLLSNAVKFTPTGGTVTVTGRHGADGALRLSVRDTGIGMTPAELAKALEPWGQIDSALSRTHIGTGLGLPLTKRLVELHDGRLEIDTAPERGTIMTLVFPAERVGSAERTG